MVARFLIEAKTASRMNHPNVVNIYDFGRTPESEGGHLYLVMELLGRSLSGLIEAGERFRRRRASHTSCAKPWRPSVKRTISGSPPRREA